LYTYCMHIFTFCHIVCFPRHKYCGTHDICNPYPWPYDKRLLLPRWPILLYIDTLLFYLYNWYISMINISTMRKHGILAHDCRLLWCVSWVGTFAYFRCSNVIPPSSKYVVPNSCLITTIAIKCYYYYYIFFYLYYYY